MKIKVLKILFMTILMFFLNAIVSNAAIISVSSSTNGDTATVSVSSSVRLGAYTVRISGMYVVDQVEKHLENMFQN